MGEHRGQPGHAASRRGGDDRDAVLGRVTAALLHDSHLMRPADVGAALERAARPLGVSAAQIYLADLQQRNLTLLQPGEGRDAAVLPVDSTLAGRAYQTITIQTTAVVSGGQGYQVWIPLVDGTERLGVLGLTVAEVSDALLDQYRTLASLAGVMVMAKSSYSDTYARTQRSREMALQAELIWATLPPRTFATNRVLLAAALEPAYEAGGDAFDYSILGDHLHVSVFDALGHDLAAGLLASVGVASCRSTRRAGGSLADIAAIADEAIAGFFRDDRFVTALLCDLDVATGLLSWIPCGHPPPLLIRGNRTVSELARPARPALGLAALHRRRRRARDAAEVAGAYTEKLQPGDRILLYTDGVTEGRAADGTPFGLDRLTDLVIRHSAARLPAPELMRRLNHAIVGYQDGKLRDDATAVLIEWLPEQPGRELVP